MQSSDPCNNKRLSSRTLILPRVRKAAYVAILGLAFLQANLNITLFAQDLTNAPPARNYNTLIVEGNQFLKDGKLKEGYHDALAAAGQDPKRFEAYALAAFILQKQGEFAKAKDILDEAITFAPAEKRDALMQFQKKLLADIGSAPSTATTPADTSAGSELTAEARRKYDALMLIVEDADKSKDAEERKKLLREFMVKSADFLALAPMQTNIWVVRGAAAIELGEPQIGWLVGRKFKELNLEDSNDPGARKFLAALERKGWLDAKEVKIVQIQSAADELRKVIKKTMAEIANAKGQLVLIQQRVFEIQQRIETQPVDKYNNLYILEEQTSDRRAVSLWQGYLRAQESNLGKLQAEMSSSQSFSILEAGLETISPPSTYALANGAVLTVLNYPDFVALKANAEAGNAGAEESLAREYLQGWWPNGRVAQDEDEGARWLRKAAEGGNTNAQFELGTYRKAADQGNAIAQFNVGLCYQNGWGVEKDLTEAASWYRRAAEQDNACAQFQLGFYYEHGIGGKDLTQAVKWYRKAAEQGNDSGQCALAACYENGLGVEKDLLAALIWYSKASGQGNSFVQNQLGYYYENGWGLEKDLTEAVKWYRKAAKQGNIYAQAALKKLETK